MEQIVTTFVALLRAVNVGGQNRVPMAELRATLTAAGYGGVQSYVQSGNLVFDVAGDEPAGDDPAEQATAIHGLIEREFGCDVHVLMLTAAELAAVAAGNPFVTAGADARWLHATFLGRPVPEAAFGGLDLPTLGDERVALAAGDAAPAGRVIYLYLPHGYGRTKLNNGWFERSLATPATTRNWRTVLALVEMSERPE